MISLNLLSPEQKKHVHQLMTLQYIKNVSFILLSGAVIISVIFFFISTLLINYEKSIDDRIASERIEIENGQATSIDAAIKDLNSQLSLGKAIQDKYIRWTAFLTTVSKEIPESVILTSMQFNAATASFRLSGTATHREDLLSFQESLKKFPYVTSVVFPVSNLAQKDNTPFEITGQLTATLYE